MARVRKDARGAQEIAAAEGEARCRRCAADFGYPNRQTIRCSRASRLFAYSPRRRCRATVLPSLVRCLFTEDILTTARPLFQIPHAIILCPHN